jgi:hypothetical protein
MYLLPNSRMAVNDASQLPRRPLRLGRLARRRRRRLLGDATTDFISPAIAEYQGQPFYQHIHDFVAGDLAAGVVDSGGNYSTDTGRCAGQAPSVSPMTAITSVATSVGPKIFAALAPVAAAGPIGAAVVIGAAVIGLFATIFKPNQYTRDEISVLCQAVPAANAVLQQIDQEVQYGTITPQQAVQALSTLVSQFSNSVSKLINHTAGNYAQTGDDTEFLLASLKAITAQRSATYQAMPAGGAAGSIVTSLSSVPPWVWLAGGFLLLA